MANFCSECAVELPTGAAKVHEGRSLCTWHYYEAIGQDPSKHYRAVPPEPPPPEPPSVPPIEAAVRERHELEDRLAAFLAIAAAMSDRELEIALARLADSMEGAPKSRFGNTHAKGKVLNCYYALRRSRAKKQSKLHRARVGFGKWNLGERLLQQIADYPLTSDGKGFTESDGHDLNHRVKLLAP